jgi:preprotein translocase subunit SecG
MSILTDIPERQRFEDCSERGAFSTWMKYSIIFAVLFCLGAMLLVFMTDSKKPSDKGEDEKEKVVEKLPVVADLPKSKSGSTAGKESTKTASNPTVKSTKSSPTTVKKTTPRKTTTKTN